MRHTLFITALVLALPASAPAQSRQPLFPTKLGLEKNWEDFLKAPLTSASVAEQVKEDPAGSLLIRWGPSRLTSLWAAVQRKVAADAKLPALLRAQQGPEAETLADEAEDLDQLMPLARRLPWAPSVHGALLRMGVRELRRGHHELASRCFHDILKYSADADTRAQAQAALWLAAAHEPHEGVLEAAFKGVDLKAEYPWLGGKATAADIRARLLGKETASTAAPLTKLARQQLEVPGSASWLDERPTVHAHGLTVGGPSSLCWFDGVQSKPKWSKSQALAASASVWGSLVPGPWQPAVHGRRVYTRWGIQSLPTRTPGVNVNLVAGLAAFDADTGAELWTTAGEPQWRELTPVNDPTHASGRLYVLAVARTQEYAPIYLVCLDANSGHFLWQRELVQNHTTFPGTKAGVRGADLAHYGNAVTVAHGLVYCQTNMGMVACCDARDGLIEWVRTCKQDREAGTLRRPGTAPLVAGQSVFFLPRDDTVLFTANPFTGELGWLQGDFDSLRETRSALSAQGRIVLLIASQKVTAVQMENGKILWERELPDTIDGKIATAGNAVYVGTKAKLYRLDLDNKGTIVEEQAWGKAGPLTGLVLRGQTLFGTTQGTSTSARPPEPELPLARAGRVVHRQPLAPQVDGQPTEWDRLPTIARDAASKLLLTHDGRHLYLGLTATGADLADHELEVKATVQGKTVRWLIQRDGQGQAIVSGDAPAGSAAAVQHNRVRGALTFEMAVPLASLIAKKPTKEPGWGRLGLEVALRGKNAEAAVVRFGENVYLHELTQPQEEAGLSLARLLPEVDSSWRFLEQALRIRAAPDAALGDLWSSYIRRQPQLPGIGQALLRLDRLLRTDATADPSGEVLQFAEEAGVPAPVRQWYKQLASAHISQRLFVDADLKPSAIELELFDGSQSQRVTASAAPPAVAGKKLPPLLLLPGKLSIKTSIINGKKRMWLNNVEVDPVTRQPLGAAPLASGDPADSARHLPLPPPGIWHEWKLPLLWLDLHATPLHGLAFKQTGGGAIKWDRTSLILDGKETILLDQDRGEGQRLGLWRWLPEPERAGAKVHTAPSPQYKDEVVRHAVTFKDAYRGHLAPEPQREQLTEERLLAELCASLPLLVHDDHAVALFARAERALAGKKDALTKLRLEILRRADAGAVPHWLETFERHEAERGTAKPRAVVAALLREAQLAPAFVQAYQQSPEPVYLRNWQVLGPLPATAALEKEALDLDRAQRLMSDRERVDLQPLLGNGKPGCAYAVCWLHVEGKKLQPALLKSTSAAPIQVWLTALNKQRLLLDEPFFPGGGLLQSATPVTLAPGWNQLLVRIESRGAGGSFALELRERDDSRPLSGVQAQAEAPMK